MVLGLWMRGSLVAHPSKATFLTPDERDVVVQRMARSKVGISVSPHKQDFVVPCFVCG